MSIEESEKVLYWQETLDPARALPKELRDILRHKLSSGASGNVWKSAYRDGSWHIDEPSHTEGYLRALEDLSINGAGELRRLINDKGEIRIFLGPEKKVSRRKK